MFKALFIGLCWGSVECVLGLTSREKGLGGGRVRWLIQA